MRRCEDCNRRIWPWQDWGGIGPIGFRLREADRAWHTACARKRVLARHEGRHERTAACSLLDCPNDTARETT